MPKDTLDNVIDSVEEINKLFDEFQKAHYEFKKTHDEQIRELKDTGRIDVLLEQKLEKINEALDAHQKQIDDFELAQNRAATALIDGKEVSVEDLDTKAAQWASSVAKLRGEVAPDFDHEGMTEYKKAYDRFLRKNTEHLTPDELKTLSVGTDTEGGYLVHPDMSGRIVQRIYETSPMRAYASVQQISTSSLEGIHDVDEAECGWVAEKGTRPTTGTPDIERWSIPVHEMYAMPRATQKILDDAEVDVEAWLAGKVSDKFSRTEAAAFVNGDGVSQPRGFLTYQNFSSAGVSQIGAIERFGTGANGAFAAAPDGGDVLLDAIYGMKSPFSTRPETWPLRLVISRRAIRSLIAPVSALFVIPTRPNLSCCSTRSSA